MNVRTSSTIPCVLDARVLGDVERRAMFALYERYYDATSFDRFRADLEGKNYVLLLHDETGALQGFSTLALYARDFEGQRVRVLFSGDTVVDETHWGQQALAFSWLELAGTLARAEPDVPIYWLLISKGHRTYRYLRAFSREFYPAPERETPGRQKRLMDFLARDRFGAAYDAACGIVRFPESRGHLRAPYDCVPERHRRLRDVQFFLARNPGYVRGEELVCLCELSADNLRPIARRAFVDGRASRATASASFRANAHEASAGAASTPDTAGGTL